jgi:hypothetical protein
MNHDNLNFDHGRIDPPAPAKDEPELDCLEEEMALETWRENHTS